MNQVSLEKIYSTRFAFLLFYGMVLYHLLNQESLTQAELFATVIQMSPPIIIFGAYSIIKRFTVLNKYKVFIVICSFASFGIATDQARHLLMHGTLESGFKLLVSAIFAFIEASVFAMVAFSFASRKPQNP